MKRLVLIFGCKFWRVFGDIYKYYVVYDLEEERELYVFEIECRLCYYCLYCVSGSRW